MQRHTREGAHAHALRNGEVACDTREGRSTHAQVPRDREYSCGAARALAEARRVCGFVKQNHVKNIFLRRMVLGEMVGRRCCSAHSNYAPLGGMIPFPTQGFVVPRVPGRARRGGDAQVAAYIVDGVDSRAFRGESGRAHFWDCVGRQGAARRALEETRVKDCRVGGDVARRCAVELSSLICHVY